MADPKLGNFTFESGEVNKINIQRTCNLDVNSMPMSDATEALIFDFDGVIKRITLDGQLFDATTTRVSGSSVLTISQQKTYLEGLANGYQSALAFSSTFESSIYVWIEGMTFDEESGNPNTLRFTMNLVVGSR